MHLGPEEILVAVSLDFQESLSGPQLEQTADELTDRLKAADARSRLFLRPRRDASPRRRLSAVVNPPHVEVEVTCVSGVEIRRQHRMEKVAGLPVDQAEEAALGTGVPPVTAELDLCSRPTTRSR
jgi:hypothetical protein